MGENLVKAVFMSVYRRLAANSIQNQVKKGRCFAKVHSKSFLKIHAYPIADDFEIKKRLRGV